MEVGSDPLAATPANNTLEVDPDLPFLSIGGDSLREIKDNLVRYLEHVREY